MPAPSKIHQAESIRGHHRYHVTHNHQNTENACVNRHQKSLQFDSAHSRFLHWMTYCRNISSETQEAECRTCPLLWCRKVCSDQKELLEHVRNCPYLSKGEYWCSLCSKPEEFHCKRCQVPLSRRLSQKELRLCVVKGAKKFFRLIGIGSVTEAPQHTTPFPTDPLSHSGSYEMDAGYAHEIGSDGVVYELEGRHGLAELDAQSFLYPSNASPGAQIRPTQPREPLQRASQFSRACPSRRPVPSLSSQISSQVSSPISPLSAGWTVAGSPVSPTNTLENDWSNDFSASGSLVTEPMSPVASMNCSMGSGLSPISPSADGTSSESGRESNSSLSEFSNATNLLQLFWDVLQEHVSISRGKISQLRDDIPIIRELVLMSPKTIAQEGFRTLRLMLSGAEPTTLRGIYTLAHISYTSLVIYREGNAFDNLKEMFVSLFHLGGALKSDQEKKIFEKVATAIWSVPVEVDSAIGQTAGQLSPYSESLVPVNTLIQACTRFLDLMEHNRPLNLYSPASLQRSLACQPEAFLTVTKLYVTVPLMSTPSLECFSRNVASVEKRVSEGHVTNIRQLELELMWVGKITSQSELLYDRFLEIVSKTCDMAHNSLFQCGLSRNEHHVQDIAVVLETISSIEEHRPRDKIPSSKWPKISIPASSMSFDTNPSSRTLSPSTPMSSFSFTSSSNNSSFSNTQSSPRSSKVLKCSICGYEPNPSGIQRWKAGNLKRHMKTTHNGKKYECTFDGCGKIFIGRKDNLLSHQRDKGHLPSSQSPFFLYEDEIEMEDV